MRLWDTFQCWALAFLCSPHYTQLAAAVRNAKMFTSSGVELPHGALHWDETIPSSS